MIQQKQKAPNLKTLQIITMALCTGVILFLAVTFFLNQDKEMTMGPVLDKDAPLFYAGVILAAAAIVFSTVLYRSMLAKIDPSLPIPGKMAQYASATITRYALLEGAALFNTVIFLLTACLINAGITAILVIIMIKVKPTLAQVMNDLNIDEDSVHNLL